MNVGDFVMREHHRHPAKPLIVLSSDDATYRARCLNDRCRVYNYYRRGEYIDNVVIPAPQS